MTLALLFGFVDPLWPDALFSFKRLHIFLFNLLTGGSVILYHTERQYNVSNTVKIYFLLALCYALFAARSLYIPTLILSVPLFVLVESVRIRRFSVLPFDFFKSKVSIADKFNQAALLCLSIGIVFASGVILNNEYLHLVRYEKLTLNVFFLGYSFPVSLITMSVMFSFMTKPHSRFVKLLMEASFWLVNLGVIVFFVFIILGLLIPEMIAATTLFFTVWMIFVLFLRTAPPVQQKTFLVSGMVFLLFTAVTGIFYLLKYYIPSLERYTDFTLVLHAMVSLYGWNLSGLFIMIRWRDFPIRLNSVLAISLHWTIVLVLAPLGKVIFPVGLVALITYISLLIVVFMGRPGRKKVRP